ncbi:MAG: hypothetical protein ACOYMA_00590 [Bacteroidia bacterium]
MSSRSEWDSCQDMRPGSAWLGQAHNLGTLGSCISKNIGVIYITDGSDFQGRGDKMIYRSAVWIVKNVETEEDVLFVQQVYPDNSAVVLEGFKNILSEKLGVKVVITGTNLIKYYEDYSHKAYDDAKLPTEGSDKCSNCKKLINEDDTILSIEGIIYCSRCYYDKYRNCTGCSSQILIKDSKISNDGDNFCSFCYDSTFTSCINCGDESYKSAAINGEDYCHSCKKKIFIMCEYCSEYVKPTKAVKDNKGRDMCPKCMELRHNI